MINYPKPQTTLTITGPDTQPLCEWVSLNAKPLVEQIETVEDLYHVAKQSDGWMTMRKGKEENVIL